MAAQALKMKLVQCRFPLTEDGNFASVLAPTGSPRHLILCAGPHQALVTEMLCSTGQHCQDTGTSDTLQKYFMFRSKVQNTLPMSLEAPGKSTRAETVTKGRRKTILQFITVPGIPPLHLVWAVR